MKIVVSIVALVAASAGIAMAQEQKGPPLQSQRPGGFNPAPPPAAQPPRPQAGGGAQPAQMPETEWLVTRNNTDLAAWITISRGLLVDKAGCVAAMREERWSLPDPQASYTIKAELMRDAECKPQTPIVCAAATERRPGLAALDLQGVGGRGCGFRPGGLKSGGQARMQSCCLVRNSTNHSMWVTVYEGVVRKIVRTACIQPGKSDWVWADQLAWMRAEITGRANCAPVPRPPCDTTINVSGNAFTGDRLRGVALLPPNWAPGGGCWCQLENTYPRQFGSSGPR